MVQVEISSPSLLEAPGPAVPWKLFADGGPGRLTDNRSLVASFRVPVNP